MSPLITIRASKARAGDILVSVGEDIAVVSHVSTARVGKIVWHYTDGSSSAPFYDCWIQVKRS